MGIPRTDSIVTSRVAGFLAIQTLYWTNYTFSWNNDNLTGLTAFSQPQGCTAPNLEYQSTPTVLPGKATLAQLLCHSRIVPVPDVSIYVAP